jgi:hypothetical protein
MEKLVHKEGQMLWCPDKSRWITLSWCGKVSIPWFNLHLPQYMGWELSSYQWKKVTCPDCVLRRINPKGRVTWNKDQSKAMGYSISRI